MWHRLNEILVVPASYQWGPLSFSILHGFFHAVLLLAIILSAAYLIITTAVLLFYRKKQYSYISDLTGCPVVTIQIPTYNELAALNCARRCLAFDYPEEKFHVLIGDDSSDASVSRKIDEFASKHVGRVTVCRRPKNIGFKPGNLNNMLEYTNGEYILIFDSDFLPEPDFLRKIVSPVMRDPGLAAVQAKWLIVNAGQNWVTILGSAIVHTLHEVMLPFLKMTGCPTPICGSAELVRKDELIRLGKWKSGALTEDIDYWCRLMKARSRTFYMDSLGCRCEAPQTARDLFRQQMRWAYGVTRSFVDHGRSLMFGKYSDWKTQTAALLFGSGYLTIATALPMVILGILSAIVGGAAGEQHFSRIGAVGDTLVSVVLTGGLLIATLCAGLASGFGRGRAVRLVLSSFSIGLALVVFVSVGISKAFAGQHMPWFMLKKTGNLQQL